MTVRKSTAVGDLVAREVRESLIRQFKDKTGLDLPRTQTIDQMIRTASRQGVRFTLVSYLSSETV